MVQRFFVFRLSGASEVRAVLAVVCVHNLGVIEPSHT